MADLSVLTIIQTYAFGLRQPGSLRNMVGSLPNKGSHVPFRRQHQHHSWPHPEAAAASLACVLMITVTPAACCESVSVKGHWLLPDRWMSCLKVFGCVTPEEAMKHPHRQACHLQQHS